MRGWFVLGQKKVRTFVNKISRQMQLQALKMESKYWPERVASRAEKRFITPFAYRRSHQEQQVLERGQRADLQVGNERVAVWSWGQGPAVLLVHGWSGRGGQFHHWVDLLLEHGFRVLCFDAPGHGDSSGETSALPRFLATIEALQAVEGPFYALIGHSLGGAATLLAAARGLAVQRLVVLAAPAEIRAVFQRTFGQRLGLGSRVIEGIQHRLVRRYGLSLEQLDPLAQTRRLKQPLLIWHDLDDREVPWSEGERLAAQVPRASLQSLKGPGHYRLLRDPRVIRDSLHFLKGMPTEGLESPQMDLLLGKGTRL